MLEPLKHKACGFLIDRYFSSSKQGSLTFEDENGRRKVYGGGEGPAAEIVVKDPKFYAEIVFHGDVGFGDAYMKGYWTTPDLDELFRFLLLNLREIPNITGSRRSFFASNLMKGINVLRYKIGNRNTLARAVANVRSHYDLSNRFFELFLDETMTYSSALFRKGSQNLKEAQIEKYDRICKISRIRRGDHVLEIGGGWGGFGLYASRQFDCKVTSISLSRQQHDYANEQIKAHGVEDRFSYRIQDYRKAGGKYDKIVSIEMIEAIGIEYLGAFFKKCNELLKPEGVLSLQVILCPESRFHGMRKGVDWIQKHIFPGGALPSLSVLLENIQQSSELFLYDFKDMGLYYAETLKQWHENFVANLAEVKELGFGGEFIRKWKYYLKYCETAFASRNVTVAQISFVRANQPLA